MKPRSSNRLTAFAIIAIVIATIVVLVVFYGDHDSAGGSPGQASYTDPGQAGPHAVGLLDLPLRDASRDNRLVSTLVWYPSEVPQGGERAQYDLVFTKLTSPKAFKNTPVKAGKYPVITFSHGLNTINYQSYETMEHWASHGYVVISTTHAGNDIAAKVQVPDATVGLPQTIIDRTGDLRFALDIGCVLLKPSIDCERVAASGHSAGGWTAFAQANGYDGLGVATARDPRIDVVLAIAPATALIPEEQLSRAWKPIMVFGGSVDLLLPAINNSSNMFNLPNTDRKYRVDVDNAGHASPSNVCELRNALVEAGSAVPPVVIDSVNLSASQACDSGIRDSADARKALNYFSTAFFDRHLKELGGYGNTDNYPYLSRGKSRVFPVCYWRRTDATPTMGRGLTSCLASA